MSNPYIRVHRKIAKHRGVQWARFIPVVAAAAAVPLVRDVWFAFLPTHEGVPVEAYADLLASVVARLATLIAAVVILASYTALVRGPDRAVLDVHPVRARMLVKAIAWSTAKTQFYLLPLAAVMLLPIAQAGQWTAYLGSLGLVASVWLGTLGVGFMVHLGGVWAAYSPSFAALLDALRGDNPRMQAALIYAPGVALVLIGGGVEFAAMGFSAALKGWVPGYGWLLIPVVLGAVSWAFVGSLAHRFYVRASLLLAEVDGAWAHAEESEHAATVYLERWAKGRPELLRALRHGWRGQRIYATGGWILGLIVGVVGWNSPAAAVFWGAGAALWVTSVSPRMAMGDPLWLDDALGVSPRRVWASRSAVAFAYALGVVVPVAIVQGVRHDQAGWEAGIGLILLSAVLSGLGAWFARVWRHHAQWAYAATALVAWAGFVRVLG